MESSAASAPATSTRRQAITGVVAPATSEALIREVRPTVASNAAIAGLARRLTETVVLAPVGWLLLAPIWAMKLLPIVSTRYVLTNRRLMIQRGLKATPQSEIPLAEIDEVRIVDATHDPFYLSATLEILTAGQVKLSLPAVPEPEGFRQAVLNASSAWAGKSRGPFLAASVKTKE